MILAVLQENCKPLESAGIADPLLTEDLGEESEIRSGSAGLQGHVKPHYNGAG